ncbi:unnamed protein product [Rotaria socialis]|uniref:Reverse transcriptase domain-containing protein n=1 Tax=Rotaria socialis TaxID=392032 RepID=A0A821SS96_9BILA|nr:unnamed protein product [Rotaria socialis]CAF4859121.1 unnamed protein product [Rotaria socialis]
MFKENKQYNIKNYSLISKNRAGHGGGVALFIHNQITYTNIIINSPLEVVCSLIHTKKLSLAVCSRYINNTTIVTEQILFNLIQQLPSSFIILGDFNAHHPVWGSADTNSRGIMINEFLINHDLCILNDGSPTYLSESNGAFSHLDLSICPIKIKSKFIWNISPFLMDSDHYPIFIEMEYSCSPINYRPKWRYSKADWFNFQNNIYLPSSFTDADSSCAAVTSAIVENATLYIPQSSGKCSPKYRSPWWNDQCSEVVSSRKRSLRLFYKNRNQENFINYKRARAQCRLILKKVKHQSWQKFVNNLDTNTTSQSVWKKINYFNKRICNKKITLNINNTIITEENKICNLLAQHFAFTNSIKNYTEPFVYHMVETEFTPINFESNNLEDYNRRFTINELKSALRNTKDSSPGNDTVSYTILKHLNENSLNQLLEFYNFLWLSDIFPSQWSSAILLPFLKTNKKSTDPNSYRPVDLTSCFCKILEKMVNRRLLYYLESNQLLSPYQSGFRKSRNTYDALVRLECEIRETFLKSEFLVAVFLDIQKAYDSVWHHGLPLQLYNIGLRGHLTLFIQNFLKNRTLAVALGTTMSETCKIEVGLPQGSILSTTLFIIKINKLFNKIPPHIKWSLFADDASLWCSASQLEDCIQSIQLALYTLDEWSDESGLRFSTDKCTYIIFTRRPVPVHTPLTIKEQPLNRVNSYKFLGIVWDSSLT